MGARETRIVRVPLDDVPRRELRDGGLSKLSLTEGVRHAVANTGGVDVVTVFGFPTPNYPATEQREPPGP